MSIRNKIFIGLIIGAVLPLALVVATIFPFHRNYLTERDVTLMGAASQNRAARTAAALKGESQETLQQIADQFPQLGQTTEVLIFSKDASGHFGLVTEPRYEAARQDPYEGMQALLTEALQDSDAHHATLPDQRGTPAVMVARRALGTDYAVIVKKDQEEVLQPHAVLRDYFLILSFIAIALSALLGLVLTRTVTGPLLRLSRTVATFNTDKPLRIEVDGNDEVASLARSFREMWERMKDYNKDLEHEVSERTSELAEAKRAMEGSNAILAAKLKEIEKLNAVMVGRETAMVEMKAELKKLKSKDEKSPPT